MSEAARVVKVTITTSDGPQVIHIDPEADGPMSVLVETGDGKKVTVNADGGTETEAPDGRRVSVDASGEMRITRTRAGSQARASKYGVRLGPGMQGVQIGDGNTQVNQL